MSFLFSLSSYCVIISVYFLLTFLSLSSLFFIISFSTYMCVAMGNKTNILAQLLLRHFFQYLFCSPFSPSLPIFLFSSFFLAEVALPCATIQKRHSYKLPFCSFSSPRWFLSLPKGIKCKKKQGLQRP